MEIDSSTAIRNCSAEETCKLIELYRECSVQWDSSCLGLQEKVKKKKEIH